MAKRILFVNHDAHRTGSPNALLHLLEWLRGNTDWEASVLLGEGGDLEPRFRALGPTFVWDPPGAKRRRQPLLARARNRLAHESVLRELAGRRFDAVYANSAATARLIPTLRPYVTAPLLCYVRELEHTLIHYVKARSFRAAQPFVKHYLADSEATRQNLLQNHGVAPGDVTRVYECIPARRYRSERARLRPAEVRAALGIPADAYVVAAGGWLQWRKGPDLLLQVGRQLAARSPRRFALLWVGGPTRGEEHAQFRYDAERLRLSDRVFVTGLSDEPLGYLAAADVFLLTSREEPLGITAMEAGVLERPVVCFEGAGGMPELLAGDRGFVVPYGDIEAMAGVVARLAADPASGADKARRFADYLCSHHDVDVIGLQIRELIRIHLLGADPPR